MKNCSKCGKEVHVELFGGCMYCQNRDLPGPDEWTPPPWVAAGEKKGPKCPLCGAWAVGPLPSPPSTYRCWACCAHFIDLEVALFEGGWAEWAR